MSTYDFTIKHVAGTSLHDADMLSRSALPAVKPTDEEEEWARFQINAVNPVCDPEQPRTVFAVGFGIGCDVMATEGTPFQLVGGCEIDQVAIDHFTDQTAATCYGSV